MVKNNKLYLLLLVLASCNFSKDVSVTLPNYNNRLAVECYIEAGKPLKAAITTTQGFFDPLSIPDVKNARVIIATDNHVDTLKYSISVSSNKGFNYESSAVADSIIGTEYRLTVIDSLGKAITAVTKRKSSPPLPDISYSFAADSSVSLTIQFSDNPVTQDYYRVLVNKDSLTTELKASFLFQDIVRVNPATNEATLSTLNKFAKGDSLIVRVFTLNKDYYQFLNSVELAKQVNGNPFVQPAQVITNIQGGFGIFTSLQYVTKGIKIQ